MDQNNLRWVIDECRFREWWRKFGYKMFEDEFWQKLFATLPGSEEDATSQKKKRLQKFLD